MRTKTIFIGSAEEIIDYINTTYIEPRNKVYNPPVDGIDIKQQLEEISANNKSKMGMVYFLTFHEQPPVDKDDIHDSHLSLDGLYVRIVNDPAQRDPI